MGVGTILGLAQPRNAWLPKLYTNNYYMLPRPGDPNIVWGSHHYLILLAKKVVLASNGQVGKMKFDLDETQLWDVGHETSMLDSTHNDLYDDIIWPGSPQVWVTYGRKVDFGPFS